MMMLEITPPQVEYNPTQVHLHLSMVHHCIDTRNPMLSSSLPKPYTHLTICIRLKMPYWQQEQFQWSCKELDFYYGYNISMWT